MPGYWRRAAAGGGASRTTACCGSRRSSTCCRLRREAGGARRGAHGRAVGGLRARRRRTIANRNQLLVGDDAAWADYRGAPSRREPAAGARVLRVPRAARGARDTRQQRAAAARVFACRARSSTLTALAPVQRCGAHPGGATRPAGALPAGRHGGRTDKPALAARYWQGLATPPRSSADEWQLRLARRAGARRHADAGRDVLRALLRGQTDRWRAGAVAARASSIVQECSTPAIQDRRRALRALLPAAGARRAARHPVRARPRSPSVQGSPTPRRTISCARRCCRARTARRAGARARACRRRRTSGARALADDARAQFEWLLKNSTRPGAARSIAAARLLRAVNSARARRTLRRCAQRGSFFHRSLRYSWSLAC